MSIPHEATRGWRGLPLAKQAAALRNTLAVLERTGTAKRHPKEVAKIRAWLAAYDDRGPSGDADHAC